MRFPLRLTAELAKAKIFRMGRGSAGAAKVILRVNVPADASEEGSSASSENSKIDDEIVERVRTSGAPIVWIGGAAEPLAYSGVGHLTRRIADLGRTVFVETNGVLLRRRIFSFRPVPKVFLAVQLNGTERSHDVRAGKNGTFRMALEGIRAAQLSGFLVCAKTTVFEDTGLGDVSELKKHIDALGLDGWMVTRAAGITQNAAAEKVLGAARVMSGRSWAAFSRLVEETEEVASALSRVNAGILAGDGQREEAFEQEVRVP
jgi:sulfatase maturation enzyme AslB (radical SAM superfamily)